MACVPSAKLNQIAASLVSAGLPITFEGTGMQAGTPPNREERSGKLVANNLLLQSPSSDAQQLCRASGTIDY